MSAAFYRTTPRSTGSSVPVHGSSQNEKKLDAILDSIREQGKKLTMLEEKGGRTLESVENLDRRLELMESKVNSMEQAISQGNTKKQRTRVPPELLVRS